MPASPITPALIRRVAEGPAGNVTDAIRAELDFWRGVEHDQWERFKSYPMITNAHGTRAKLRAKDRAAMAMQAVRSLERILSEIEAP